MSEKPFPEAIQSRLDRANRIDKLVRASLDAGDASQAASNALDLIRERRQIASDYRGDARLLRHLAGDMDGLGQLLHGRVDVQLALDSFKTSHALFTVASEVEPDDREGLFLLACSCNNLGLFYMQCGLAEPAAEAIGQHHYLIQDLANAEPGNPEYQAQHEMSYMNAGNLWTARGEPDRARVAFRRCAELREERSAARPADLEVKRALSTTYLKIVLIDMGSGDWASAVQWSEKAVQIREHVAAADPRRPEYALELATAWLLRGNAEAQGGRRGEARRSYLAGLKPLESVERLAPGDPRVRPLQDHLAEKLREVPQRWYEIFG